MADAERVVAAAKANGRKLVIGYILRHHPSWVRLIAEARALGGPPRTAEVGITLAREHQGRALAAEILRALVGALFEAHGMHRVIAHADDRNAPVHRLLERVGFRCEGRFVDADWFEGGWETLRLYAVLEREWGARTLRQGQ